MVSLVDCVWVECKSRAGLRPFFMFSPRAVLWDYAGSSLRFRALGAVRRGLTALQGGWAEPGQAARSCHVVSRLFYFTLSFRYYR